MPEQIPVVVFCYLFSQKMSFVLFFAAAPKVSQSQVHSGIAISKPFAGVGGHPAPESGQTRLASQPWVHVSA